VLAVLALSALAAGAYVYVTAVRPPVFDRASLCPVDGARSMTVVLLDSTDEIPDIGKREIRTVLLDMAETVPVYGLLELRLLDPKTPGGRQIFAKCNPGNGSGERIHRQPGLGQETMAGRVSSAARESWTPASGRCPARHRRSWKRCSG
jgi:hypothetical protein